ncbi:hypothetical protein SOPP22_06775 [Shewanella sp. OPT22]|nr:hypothetical protein SOPP22_06775 [Shewanella sp. OPT22]
MEHVLTPNPQLLRGYHENQTPKAPEVVSEEHDWLDIGAEIEALKVDLKEDVSSFKTLTFDEKINKDTLNSLPLEYPQHPMIYQPLSQQFVAYTQLTASETQHPELVKETALSQLNLDSKRSSQMYRAIQTLEASKAGGLKEFQDIKKQKVTELARFYLRAKFGQDNAGEDELTKLVEFCAERFGYEKVGAHPEFRKFAAINKLTISLAYEFLGMADAYLSPAKLYESMSNKDAAASQILFGHSVKSVEGEEEVGKLKEENGKYSAKEAKLDYSECELDLAKVPTFSAKKTHPHIYIPMFEAALEKCDSMQQLSALVVNTLYSKENVDESSFKLLVILVENRARVLCQKGAIDSPFELLSLEHKISSDELLIFCKVFSHDVLTSVFAVLVVNDKFPVPVIKELSFEHLELFPKGYLGSLSWKISKPIVMKAIKANRCDVVLKEDFNQLDEDSAYELMFSAVTWDRVSIVKHMFEQQRTGYELSVSNKRQPGDSKHGSRNVFTHACFSQSIETLKYLMNTFAIDVESDYEDKSTTSYGSMAAARHCEHKFTLQALTERGFQDVMCLLLSNYDAKEKINISCLENATNLLQLACKHDQLKVVKAIIPLETKLSASNLTELKKWAKGSSLDYLTEREDKSVQNISEAVNTADQWKLDHQQTMFFKQRRFEDALREGQVLEMTRWERAGYKARIPPESLLGNLTYSLKHKHPDVAVKLLGYVEPATLMEWFYKKEQLALFVNNIPAAQSCSLIEAITKGSSLAITEGYILKLATLALKSGDMAQVKAIMNYDLGERKKNSSLRNRNASCLIIDAVKPLDIEQVIALLDILERDQQKVLLGSSQFLQTLISCKSTQKLTVFCNKLEALDFSEGETRKVVTELYQLAVAKKVSSLVACLTNNYPSLIDKRQGESVKSALLEKRWEMTNVDSQQFMEDQQNESGVESTGEKEDNF